MHQESRQSAAPNSPPIGARAGDTVVPAADDPNAARERENARRAAIAVILIVGSMLIYRMTAMLDPIVSAPTPVVYGASGAVFGAICGAVQRADELEDRVLHTLLGAVILAVIFAVFSLSGPLGPRTYPWSMS